MRTHIAVGFCIGLMAASCGTVVRELDASHCANQTGNDWCAERHGGERSFCVRGTCGPTEGQDGCAESRPAEDECYSPCGVGSTVLDDASCLGVSSSSDSGSSTSGTTAESGSSSESSTTGPMPCVGNEDCPDAAAPFCEAVSGECVGCEGVDDPDGACAGLDPGMPLCVGGACVACTPENPLVCEDQLLLCDGGTSTCIQCTEHDQCGSGACELAVGRCFPEDLVVHVDGDGGQDYMTIVAAVAAVDDGTHGVIVVHELDMAAPYATSVTIDGGKTIALLAAPGEAPIIQGTGGNPGLRVEGAGTIVYMDGLRLRNGDVQGLVVDGAFAWVDRSHIVQNTGGGVQALNAAELTLRNCFVGDGTNGEHALAMDGTVSMPSAEISYTTLGVGVDNFNDVFPVFCDGAVEVTVRNSLLVSFDNPVELSCSMATVTNTASEALIPGTGNVVLGNVGADWFVSIDTGNFHLDNPPAMLPTTARWQTGDPLTDIDGQPRPTVDGTADYAGADVP